MTPGFRLVAAACATLLAACQAQDESVPEAAASSPALPALPVAEAQMDRRELLLAVIEAGSAAAAGVSDAQAQRELDGKRFELRLRFGCPNGSAREDAGRRATFDEENRLVQLEAASEISMTTPPVEYLKDGSFEAAEGFWISHPWILEPACPAIPASAVPSASPANPAASTSPTAAPLRPSPSPLPPGSGPGRQVGIVQLFTASDTRTHRRDSRAYRVTERLSENEHPSQTGYDVVIEGRLQALPDGRVIACRASAGRAPTCLISARFEQVAIERADTGAQLAEWPSG